MRSIAFSEVNGLLKSFCIVWSIRARLTINQADKKSHYFIQRIILLFD